MNPQIALLQLQREEKLIESERQKIEADKIKIAIAELHLNERIERAAVLAAYLEAES